MVLGIDGGDLVLRGQRRVVALAAMRYWKRSRYHDCCYCLSGDLTQPSPF